LSSEQPETIANLFIISMSIWQNATAVNGLRQKTGLVWNIPQGYYKLYCEISPISGLTGMAGTGRHELGAAVDEEAKETIRQSAARSQ
jgi:hypothetical protein